MIKHIFNISNSTIASIIRSWQGTSATQKDFQPEKELVLFDREGCPKCRLVREYITALNLNVTMMPCPKGGRNLNALERQIGKCDLPLLYDANTEKRYAGAADICKHLATTYKGSDLNRDIDSLSNQLTSLAASIVRFGAGNVAKRSKPVPKPLTLYSFESSPFSRPVRELLCELEIPYQLITLGKQQRADMGPAVARMHLGPYVPVRGSKREQFLKEHGDVQVPYLIDPNTQKSLFESKQILQYLKKEYAR